MLADEMKVMQRKIVKKSFEDKLAALKKQESEFSHLVSDLFTLRELHDSLQEKMNAYKDTYLNKSKSQLVVETGLTTAELRYIMSVSTALTSHDTDSYGAEQEVDKASNGFGDVPSYNE